MSDYPVSSSAGGYNRGISTYLAMCTYTSLRSYNKGKEPAFSHFVSHRLSIPGL